MRRLLRGQVPVYTSKLAAEGAVLEGGEEGIGFDQGGAVGGFQRFDRVGLRGKSFLRTQFWHQDFDGIYSSSRNQRLPGLTCNAI